MVGPRHENEKDGGGGGEFERLTEAELLTLVANIRGTTEMDVANEYTPRHLAHVAATYLRDKLFVLSTVLKGFGKRDGGKAGRSLPSWYKAPSRKGQVGVVDLDGPLEGIRPFVGGVGGSVGTAKTPGTLPWTSARIPTDAKSVRNPGRGRFNKPAGRFARQAAIAAVRSEKE